VGAGCVLVTNLNTEQRIPKAQSSPLRSGKDIVGIVICQHSGRAALQPRYSRHYEEAQLRKNMAQFKVVKLFFQLLSALIILKNF
jgi:hypothetical protein